MREMKPTRRYNDFQALKEASLAKCRDRFRERFGRDWDPKWAGVLRNNARMQGAANERLARDLYVRLRAAMQEAEQFVRETAVRGGRCQMFLAQWVPEHISPLLQHASMQVSADDWGKNLEDGRAQLVDLLDKINLFQLPEAAGGGSSFLDNTDYAIVSLLTGFWPTSKKEGCTVAEVIEAEAAAMKHHVKQHGVKDADPHNPDPEERIIAKRGPKYRLPPPARVRDMSPPNLDAVFDALKRRPQRRPKAEE